VLDARRVRLADGRLARIRALGPRDRAAFLAFHAGVSEGSRAARRALAAARSPERASS